MTKRRPEGGETRGERMLALRRARMAAAPPVLRGGFRPFFLAAALWAVVAIGLWVAMLSGLPAPGPGDWLAWHRHEMLFGFVGAAIAGYYLTAIPNRSGRLPVAGPPLAALALLWLAGRVALLLAGGPGGMVAMLVDGAFPLVLALLGAREALVMGNRNLPLVGLVLLLGIASVLDHGGAAGWVADDALGWRAGLALIVALIAMVGGRLVPSFTRNWLARNGATGRMPGQPDRYDRAGMVVTAAALAGWAVWPDARATGLALAAAAVAQAGRMARWRGVTAARDPLVLSLHLGFAWLPAGLALLAAAVLGGPVPRTAALHALAAGAMATMILAVMTRTILSQTARDLRAGPLTVAAYALVTLGALARVATAFDLLGYQVGIAVSGGLWVAAFGAFLAGYAPILFAPRVGER